jgi:hypothetical protein
MKKIFSFFLLLLPILMLPQALPPAPPPPPPPSAPIDGSILVLILAGLAYGIKKIKN